MKKTAVMLLLFVGLAGSARADKGSDLELLQRFYPKAVAQRAADGLVLTDGVRLVYDDGRVKSAEAALEDPDLEDMLAQPYPLDRIVAEPAPGVHPGRCRVTALFQAAYGHDASEVKANLVPVLFLGSKVLFNRQNGAAAALEAVGRDLEALMASRPEIRTHLLPLSGTFAWRPIAGTGRLSMHSFGAAIDVNAKRNGYWRWQKGGDALAMRKAFPPEAVEIFERHGFIWGGKWAEFDIMHFEYRPELIAKAKGGR